MGDTFTATIQQVVPFAQSKSPPYVMADGTIGEYDLGTAMEMNWTSLPFSAPNNHYWSDYQLKTLEWMYMTQMFKTLFCQDEGLILPGPQYGTGYGVIDFSVVGLA